MITSFYITFIKLQSKIIIKNNINIYLLIILINNKLITPYNNIDKIINFYILLNKR